MGFYAKKILLLVLAAIASGQVDEEEQFHPDSLQSDSQTIYKFVNLPGRSIKYISPLGPSSIYSPKIRTYVKYRRPVYPIKTRPNKSVFTPNPKFTSYALYRASNLGSKNLFSKRPAVFDRYGGQFYKPIQHNFNTDLTTVKLPLSISQNLHPEQFDVANLSPNGFKGDFDLQTVPNFYLRKTFLESASQKQIEQYLEDLHKQEDEKIELQLLNDPNPEAKGKYQQFLKAKEDEKIEKEYLENLQKTEKEVGSSYAPIRTQEQDVIVRKPDTPGLRHFRTLHSDDPSAYEFEIAL